MFHNLNANDGGNSLKGNWTFLKMRSDVILSIKQFHRALFSKVFHGGTTCRNGGYAMDDNGKRIAWQTNELYANIVEIR